MPPATPQAIPRADGYSTPVGGFVCVIHGGLNLQLRALVGKRDKQSITVIGTCRARERATWVPWSGVQCFSVVRLVRASYDFLHQWRADSQELGPRPKPAMS
jgi:hypothetical protein